MLTKVYGCMTPQEKADSLKKPPKRKKGEKSGLQKSKDSPNSGYWSRKASKSWGTYIHTKYTGCLVCGKTHGKLDAHHLLTKGSQNALKHHPMNGVLLCVHHHKWDRKMSAHGTPELFKRWLEENHPDKFEWMENNRKTPLRPNIKQAHEDLEQLIKEL